MLSVEHCCGLLVIRTDLAPPEFLRAGGWSLVVTQDSLLMVNTLKFLESRQPRNCPPRCRMIQQ